MARRRPNSSYGRGIAPASVPGNRRSSVNGPAAGITEGPKPPRPGPSKGPGRPGPGHLPNPGNPGPIPPHDPSRPPPVPTDGPRPPRPSDGPGSGQGPDRGNPPRPPRPSDGPGSGQGPDRGNPPKPPKDPDDVPNIGKYNKRNNRILSQFEKKRGEQEGIDYDAIREGGVTAKELLAMKKQGRANRLNAKSDTDEGRRAPLTAKDFSNKDILASMQRRNEDVKFKDKSGGKISAEDLAAYRAKIMNYNKKNRPTDGPGSGQGPDRGNPPKGGGGGGTSAPGPVVGDPNGTGPLRPTDGPGSGVGPDRGTGGNMTKRVTSARMQKAAMRRLSRRR